MVLSGDLIDGTLGVVFGLSTLAAAALGNSVSNSERRREPNPRLTPGTLSR